MCVSVCVCWCVSGCVYLLACVGVCICWCVLVCVWVCVSVCVCWCVSGCVYLLVCVGVCLESDDSGKADIYQVNRSGVFATQSHGNTVTSSHVVSCKMSNCSFFSVILPLKRLRPAFLSVPAFREFSARTGRTKSGFRNTNDTHCCCAQRSQTDYYNLNSHRVFNFCIFEGTDGQS
jgi:hypothetical protein